MSKNRTPAVHVNPGSSADLTDTTDIELGGLDKQIVLEGAMSIEELRDSLNARVTTSLDTRDFKSFVQDTAFMEEQVLVRVHPTTEKNAEMIIDVYNNGTPQRFMRGQYVIAKRKYVEVLARAKPFSVETPEFTDGNGDRSTRIDVKVGLRYPFDMQDKNPRGQAWLQSILQEA